MSTESATSAARTGALDRSLIRLFLCGDVMTGRGIDQILPTPSNAQLFEPSMRSALQYVELAEAHSGALPRGVAWRYIWGAALDRLAHSRAHLRIVNLETAVTRSDAARVDKSIHYRMHPANVECLEAAGIDCCVLANNHVLDWGRAGLTETLQTLHGAGIATCGAGCGLRAASAPAVLSGPGTRVLVFAVATASSGVPRSWRARTDRSGVNWIEDVSGDGAQRIARQIERHRHGSDRVIVSVHWGGNWGYEVSRQERLFARRLIDVAGVDVVHGHSSHHPKGLEIYRERVILYGCGDFLNDYEGIDGYEAFRPQLTLMYFPVLDGTTGQLRELRMVPLKIHRFRLEPVSTAEAKWLCATIDRESRASGTRVSLNRQGVLNVSWKH